MSEKCRYGDRAQGQTGEEFVARVSKVDQFAPQANPARYVASKTDVVASYDFKDVQGTTVKDASGNGYDATLNGVAVEDGSVKLDGSGFLSLPFDTLGYPYTVQFDLTIGKDTPENAPIFKGRDGTFYYNYDNTGKFGFERKGYAYLFDFNVPTDTKMSITLTCSSENQVLETNLYVDGAKIGQGMYYKVTGTYGQKSSTFVLPVEQIGSGIVGSLENLILYNRAFSTSQVLGGDLFYGNLALNKSVTVSAIDGGKKPDGSWAVAEYAPEMAVDGDRATRVVFPRREKDSWFVVDLGKECLIDSTTIRFAEIPNSYELLASTDGEHYEHISLREGLPGRDTTPDSVTFEQAVRARYIKYHEIEGFFIEGIGEYSGYFYEFEVYGCEADAIDQAIAAAEQTVKDTVQTAENKAYLEKLAQNAADLKALCLTSTGTDALALASMLQKQTADFTQGNVRPYQLDTTKLKTLLETQVAHDDFFADGYSEYQKAMSYGRTIYYSMDSTQEQVDRAAAGIQAAQIGRAHV